MALDEVAATTSVLLGFAPPLSLADDSSAKVFTKSDLSYYNFHSFSLQKKRTVYSSELTI